jgi:hypothetical protein
VNAAVISDNGLHRYLLSHRAWDGWRTKTLSLGLTKGRRQPRHPLYVKGDTTPQEYR